MEIQIGYADFIALLRVHDPREWEGFRIKPNGVYINLPPDELPLLAEERAVVTDHAGGNPDMPVLQFPCGLDSLKKFVGSESFEGLIDTFNALRWFAGKLEEKALDEAKDNIKHELEEKDRRLADLIATRDTLHSRIAELEHEIATKTAAAEASSRRIAELQDQLDTKSLHKTRLSAAADAVTERFWKKCDLNNPPSQSEVIAWLTREYSGEISQTEAKTVDRVCRPDVLRDRNKHARAPNKIKSSLIPNSGFAAIKPKSHTRY